MQHRPQPIVIIVGPTAAGKTELAVALAQRLPGGGECICADSMQVYRGMDLGTAKPTAAQRALVPHHLLDIADPADGSFSVDNWLSEAEQCIAAIRERGCWPLVVGGTNLYVQALLKGLCDGPPPDPALRLRLQQLDAAELHRRLEQVDPGAASRIHRNDRKRAVRALEVHARTGQRLSELQQEWAGDGHRPDAIVVGLEYAAEDINRRINARVHSMIESGLVEEVADLERRRRLGLQAREALGYKQIIEHLEGSVSLSEAIEQIKIRTRRFAKQQRTWLRRFRVVERSIWLPASELSMEALVQQALRLLIERSSADEAAGESGSAAPSPPTKTIPSFI